MLRLGDHLQTRSVIDNDLRGEGDRARHRPLRDHAHRVHDDRRRARRPSMLFRILKFKPGHRPRRRSGRGRPRPTSSRAEAAAPGAHARQRVLVRRAPRSTSSLIQRCASCARAAPPAAPALRQVRLLRVGHASRQRRAAPSTATWSTTTRRSPRSTTRCRSRLIELEEGTRLVADIVGIEPGDVEDRHGRRASSGIEHDDELTLPAFRPGRGEPRWTSRSQRRADAVRDLAEQIFQGSVDGRAGEGGRGRRRRASTASCGRRSPTRTCSASRCPRTSAAAASGSSSCASCSSSRAASSRRCRSGRRSCCGALPIAEFGTDDAARRAGCPAWSRGDVFLTAALAEAGVNDALRPAGPARRATAAAGGSTGVKLSVPAAHVARRGARARA